MEDDLEFRFSLGQPATNDGEQPPAVEGSRLPPSHEGQAGRESDDQGSTELPSAEPEIQRGIQQVLEAIQSLRHDFETKIKYDETKERQITLLHNELQEQRQGLHFRILRPLLLDLIALYDDIAKLLESTAEESLTANQSRRNLESIQQSIEEMLRRNGVEPFTVEGDAVSIERQRVLKVLPTSEPLLDKKIAQRLRTGFSFEGRVLRPEWVEVYRYTDGNA